MIEGRATIYPGKHIIQVFVEDLAGKKNTGIIYCKPTKNNMDIVGKTLRALNLSVNISFDRY